MRITAGNAKGKKLHVPEIPGIKLSQEVVRQAIFSIIGERIKNCVCLDLFAGSGSIGLEALSRGSAWCDFVDNNNESIQTIIQNIKICSFSNNSSVQKSDALKYLLKTEKRYDFVFLDPFYRSINLKHLFKTLEKILIPQGKIFFLHDKNSDIKEIVGGSNFKIKDQRFYGATGLTVLVDNKN